jgi:integrase
MARKPAAVEGVYQREGSDSWYARYWQNGKKVRKSFGRDRDAAIAYLEKARLLKRTGEGVVPTTAKRPVLTFAEMRANTAGVTLGELCDGLLKQIQDDPERYKDQHNPPQRIGLIKKAFGSRPADSIQTHEVADWLQSLGRAPATHDRYKAVFSAIYKYGKSRSKVTTNPVRDVEPRRIDNGIIRWLKPSEEAKLRAVLQADVDACGPQNERLKKHLLHRIYEFEVALGTGMRKGEQYGLTWEDVDFESKEITAWDTKNGTSRIVHMDKDVVAAMKRLKATPLPRKQRSKEKPNDSPDNSVFSIGDNKKWWASALRRAKIRDFRWHDLRHTFCSRLAQNGESLKVIQELAGHKTIQMAARYSHLDKKTVVKALNRKQATAARNRNP